MSHEIEKNDCMVSANSVVPWHGLGVQFTGVPTAHEALVAAKLDWQVTQESVFDADLAEIEGFKLNRRSDDRSVLGIVNKNWTPLQNERLLEIAEAVAQVDGQEFKPVIETAGSLRGGRMVWALVQTGQRQFAGSAHKAYLLLSNGHDGKRAVRGTATDVRVVCANTLRMAEADVPSLFVTHTTKVEERVEKAIEMLGWANDATKATFAIYEALAKCQLNYDGAARFFADILPAKKVEDGELRPDPGLIDDMLDLWKGGAGNEGKTLFDAVNAVTDWADHQRKFRAGGSPESRFLFNSLGGEGDRLKVKALRHAADLVAAGS